MISSQDNHMTILYFYLMTHFYLIFPPESHSGVSSILGLFIFPPESPSGVSLILRLLLFPPESLSGVSPIYGLFQV